MINIKEKVKKLLEKNDISWYKQIIKKAPFGSKFSEEKLIEIVEKTIQEAEGVKKDLEKLNLKKPSDYLSYYGIDVEYVSEKQSWGYQYLGMFKHKTKTVVINTKALELIKTKIKTLNIAKINSGSIRDVATMHEFFHFLEDFYPDSFTKQKLVETKILGIIKSKSQVSILKEVAAIHFSKITTNLAYSPIVFQKIYNLKLE